MLRQSSRLKGKPAAQEKSGLQQAPKKDNIMRRRKILDLAVKDSKIIKTALSSKDPPKELKKAKHLTTAYKNYLKMMKEEVEQERPWTDNPQSQAYAEALHSFSKHVCDYSDAKDNNPEWAKIFPLGNQEDLPMNMLFGVLNSSKGVEDLAAPVDVGSLQEAKTRITVKTDQEILQLAMKDISIVLDALSLEAPVKKLKSAKNLMKAYREFMKKGRVEGVHPRTWEKEPASELFCGGLLHFSKTLREYSTYKERAPTQAKQKCDPGGAIAWLNPTSVNGTKAVYLRKVKVPPSWSVAMAA